MRQPVVSRPYFCKAFPTPKEAFDELFELMGPLRHAFLARAGEDHYPKVPAHDPTVDDYQEVFDYNFKRYNAGNGHGPLSKPRQTMQKHRQDSLLCFSLVDDGFWYSTRSGWCLHVRHNGHGVQIRTGRQLVKNNSRVPTRMIDDFTVNNWQVVE